MTTAYKSLDRAQLQEEFAAVSAHFADLKAQALSLNMARGKPGKEQLDLVSDILTVLQKPEDCVSYGVDARNYGELTGLQEAKELFADLLGCKPEECFIGGNASLTLMYDTISKAYTHGLLHSEKPWCKLDKIKFLCPSPGYDRHFKITESFGFELITIPMTPTGPDMDMVEDLIKDPTVKGMWCVPKYSNPDGIIYSDRVIHALASMKPAAPDFAIMWDNAYCIHEFDGDFVPFPDILKLCAEYGNADMVYEFASTSKVTFPGAGISCRCASEANIAYFQKTLGVQIISFDKVNQLRHVRFLKDKETTLALMKKHAEILKPRFAAVCDALDREIVSRGIGRYNRPKGGYFVCLYAMPLTAMRALQLVTDAGVTMTPAGATYPYGQDPFDSNIRIAPTLPPVEELEQAIDVFCLCLRIAALEQLLKAASN
ncbi:MAG: aminotransferase class I/II-fold pyridoxal phosphate-dependent enzyme [Oscillospiraceae bacterium]|nr:aminotransferase class I/II-fold pyridoxal phosphate-dependent enzyme [Oscillospiraceae bacterium]